MKVLVVEGGGREHALCWTISGSPLVEKLWCAPGNAGIAQDAHCVDISSEDVDALVRFSVENKVELVVIGPGASRPEASDGLREKGIRAFGPSATRRSLKAQRDI